MLGPFPVSAWAHIRAAADIKRTPTIPPVARRYLANAVVHNPSLTYKSLQVEHSHPVHADPKQLVRCPLPIVELSLCSMDVCTGHRCRRWVRPQHCIQHD